MGKVSVQLAAGEPPPVPPEEIERWVQVALEGEEAEVTVRLVDEEEISELNRRYCKKDAPTNVLSFSAELPPWEEPYLGDVVICLPVVKREAEALGKSFAEHLAHMVVHGLLHLRGYDHVPPTPPEEAEAMRKKEGELMERLGFANPYFSVEQEDSSLR